MSPGTLQELIQVLAKPGRLLAAFHDPDTDRMARPTKEDQPQCKQMRREVVKKIKDLIAELEEFSVEFKRTMARR